MFQVISVAAKRSFCTKLMIIYDIPVSRRSPHCLNTECVSLFRQKAENLIQYIGDDIQVKCFILLAIDL